MDALFLKVLNMSLTASYVILTVLLARLLLMRAPKKYAYALWSVVGFRLCCPASFRSVFSLFRLNPFKNTAAQLTSNAAALHHAPGQTGMMPQMQLAPVIPEVNAAFADNLPAAAQNLGVNPMQSVMDAAALVWCAGVLILLLYSLITLVRLNLRLRTAIRLEGNVYQSEQVGSPFVLGIFRPRIYLPFGLDEKTRGYVLAHERCHIRHFDPAVKLFAFFLLCLHWFNPLCWLAFFLMSRDMEMRCDECVLGAAHDLRRAYSLTLLSFGTNRRFPAPVPLAFGESGVRVRIKNALRWKKPKLWLTVAAVLICAAVLAACAADPKHDREPRNPFGSTYRVESIVYDAPLYSFSLIPETTPLYCLSADYCLFSAQPVKDADTPFDWEILGNMQAISLTKENFDAYFWNIESSAGWVEGENAASAIRKGNAACWRLVREMEQHTELYYVLQQSDGRVYLAYGYYDPEGETDPDSDDGKIRWLFTLTPKAEDTASTTSIGGAEQPKEITTNPVPADRASDETSYVSYACLYMSPLSSTLSGADSGCRYVLSEKEIRIENLYTGSVERFALPEAGWTPLPYTQEEWDARFVLYAPSIDGFETREFMQLDSRFALLKLDAQLWIVNGLAPEEDSRVWSVYALTPEAEMGAAAWVYRPHNASAPQDLAFRFTLGEDVKISLACMEGILLDEAHKASKDGLLSLDGDGMFFWSPGETEPPVSVAAIRFTVREGERFADGTIYISAYPSDAQDGGIVYIASPVGALTVSQGENIVLLSRAEH